MGISLIEHGLVGALGSMQAAHGSMGEVLSEHKNMGAEVPTPRVQK